MKGGGGGRDKIKWVPLNSLEKIQKQTTKLLVSHISLMNREAYPGLFTVQGIKMS